MSSSDNKTHALIESTYQRSGESLPAGLYPLSPEQEGVMHVVADDTSTVHHQLFDREDFQSGADKGRRIVLIAQAIDALAEGVMGMKESVE
ncbi:MAG TPA: hypothetical protein VD947_04640 [Patescibacteria group bacterium]|nr:hypothetical protein [Patescibacteria group bacterium]